jgi:hypothetical protein
MKISPRSQFEVLFRVFLLRVIDLEALSTDGSAVKLLGQFGAVFAGISFLFVLPLILTSGALAEADVWTMAHLLIATTFTAVGLATILAWDSLVPERRDVLILGPLPVRTRTLFFAKLAAVGALPALVIGSLNVFTGLSWPFLFATHAGVLAAIRSLGAYWIAVTLAGAFAAFLVIALQGITMQLLPRQVYLRLSAPLQALAFCAITGLYFLEPSLESRQALTAPENQALLHWLPAYWFLGLFQRLNGSAFGAFASLAHLAWMALWLVGALAVGALFAAYVRTLPRLIEQPDILPSRRRMLIWPRKVKSVRLAIVIFALRTLQRSRQHRMIVSFYLGVGGAAALAYARVGGGGAGMWQGLRASDAREVAMSTTIVLMCIAVAAIRVSFSLPVKLQANWIFRMAQLRDMSEYLAASRVVLSLLGVMPIVFCSGAVLFALWPFPPAAIHSVALMLLGGGLAEWSLAGFRKLPFTCSYLPGRANSHMTFWLAVLFLIPIANELAHLEARMLATTVGSIFLIAIPGLVWAAARVRNRTHATGGMQLMFEEQLPPEVFSLKLDRG